MQGATENAELFKSGQYGRLYLEAGVHARGKTFQSWVLPADVLCTGSPRSLGDAVEVYGIVSGNPGWTESYGWLHKGPWEHDFSSLVEQRRLEILKRDYNRYVEQQERKDAEQKRIQRLLAEY